ncbi:alpha-L-fucosidase [Flammeovirga kamogawensis]|uniref:alpha-L-fucosidase n=1 Tax=Flammeovirga kamogawensis TaxID=373891 RepID=A0ABX8GQI6_9BACT|nr:alpha-L-fucosidase [Flammeovirga kamogawensis]MBB6463083.1 alpha-L-fucosidase [Flammeovirga kamogawensis]QWG05718.1 alpha-L-fucosidase [Flammeovirga kamogawensis]TRX67547.1 alpha-L-fucosidase [Flammeovirga kamogawensis]
MKRIILALLFTSLSIIVFAQETKTTDERMEWFKDAKLGVFIHWGYYGVNGISESWSMYHQKITWEDYMQQGEKFTADKYDPKAWAKLFKSIGADYVVMTSKHHDGFALWDSKYSKLDAKDHAAAGRDLYTPFVNAVRGENMKVGVYYSLCDWSHPDYSPITFPRNEKALRKLYPQGKTEKYLTAWQRFQKFNMNQMGELFDNYTPDLVWFDGDWEHKADEWPSRVIKDSLLSWNPNVIVNSRLNQYGDYNTPEQDPPIMTPDRPWELCMTMNTSWGYFPSDKDYKSSKYIVETFVETIAKGGNLLLNIGPKPNGEIAQEQKQRLEDLGRWINKHNEAVHGTVAGMEYGHYFGPTTLSEDRTIIYLYNFQKPSEFTSLKGVKNKVKKIRVVGSDKELDYKVIDSAPWNEIPGIIQIFTPQDIADEYATVIAVELEGELELYRGIGHAVEMND